MQHHVNNLQKLTRCFYTSSHLVVITKHAKCTLFLPDNAFKLKKKIPKDTSIIVIRLLQVSVLNLRGSFISENKIFE